MRAKVLVFVSLLMVGCGSGSGSGSVQGSVEGVPLHVQSAAYIEVASNQWELVLSDRDVCEQLRTGVTTADQTLLLLDLSSRVDGLDAATYADHTFQHDLAGTFEKYSATCGMSLHDSTGEGSTVTLETTLPFDNSFPTLHGSFEVYVGSARDHLTGSFTAVHCSEDHSKNECSTGGPVIP